jgi:hypothetical protein
MRCVLVLKSTHTWLQKFRLSFLFLCISPYTFVGPNIDIELKCIMMSETYSLILFTKDKALLMAIEKINKKNVCKQISKDNLATKWPAIYSQWLN